MKQTFKLVGLLLAGAALWMAAGMPDSGLKVGDTAPDFRLKKKYSMQTWFP